MFSIDKCDITGLLFFTMEFRFISADCGHAITLQNIGGKCERCGKLCCRDCLTLLNDEMLCPTCFVEKLKE